jgi:hypothetical protein
MSIIKVAGDHFMPFIPEALLGLAIFLIIFCGGKTLPTVVAVHPGFSF